MNGARELETDDAEDDEADAEQADDGDRLAEHQEPDTGDEGGSEADQMAYATPRSIRLRTTAGRTRGSIREPRPQAKERASKTPRIA